ncbi:hypothetical protein Ade02nite_19530 [Paractinoplanes deccanensis]|uniref:Uncharacterized protein n=1 Tax=Paractinoplanes deccanensis TaxID=113561 RepID=A0ABQ3Y040_9ACTN|nr:hypothetical protein [Actinoplanes deccanensis]GID73312.1 hypothetical protein Ade02nite_19530 [Actinoplanes deccanensis]
MNWRRARTITAWILLFASLIGWPISMVTFAKDEPAAVLSLSWLAIIIEAGSLLTASQVHEEQAGDGD